MYKSQAYISIERERVLNENAKITWKEYLMKYSAKKVTQVDNTHIYTYIIISNMLQNYSLACDITNCYVCEKSSTDHFHW